MNALVGALFSNLQPLKSQTIQVLPNITGGIDFISGGQHIGSIMPSIGSDVLVDANHDVIGHIRENVMGGTQIDLGYGNSIKGLPNIYGGETYHDGFGHIIGYTKPNIYDGVDFISASGDHYSTAPNIFDGLSINVSPALDGLHSTFDSISEYVGSIDHLDAFNAVNDFHDIVDGLEIYHKVMSWF